MKRYKNFSGVTEKFPRFAIAWSCIIWTCKMYTPKTLLGWFANPNSRLVSDGSYCQELYFGLMPNMFVIWSIFFNIKCLNILIFKIRVIRSDQIRSVAQSCPTLCDPMNCSTLGLPVHHQLPEYTQTHVHRVSDAIQPSHPLLSPSPPARNPSQHQSLFQWVSSSHEVAKILEFQL